MLDQTTARPPVAASPLSVILIADGVPGEEAASALDAWQSYLGGLERPSEILLVRPQLPEEPALAPESPRVSLYDPAQGLGAGLRQAITVACYPLVVVCTWDRQYRPEDLDRMLKAIDPVDGVIGYRTGRPIPAWRRVLDLLVSVLARILLGTGLEPRRSWFGLEGWQRRWVARWIFGLRLADPECPYRLLRREVLTRMSLQSRGAFVHVEILAKANHLACLLAEEPVTWSVPSEVAPELVSFREDAAALFRHPDFGPPPATVTR